MKYILITGTPLDGFIYRGPFDDAHLAVDWAEKEMGLNIDWWVTELKKPEERYDTPSWPTSALEDLENAELCKLMTKYLEGKQISFKDGDPHNYSVDNLELIPIKNSHFEVHDIPEINTTLDRMQYEDIIDAADTDSYASSLPGVDQHNIMDTTSEEDIPL